MSRGRRITAVALAWSLAAPLAARGSVQAAPPGDVDARAVALCERGQFLAAAKAWEDALAAVPEGREVRARRNGWVTGAVNAYNAAFEADPSRCDLIHKSIRLADRYLEALILVYFASAREADDYRAMRERRYELDVTRARKGCPQVPSAPTSPAVGAPQVEAAPVTSGDAASSSRARLRSPGLVAGLGASSGLGVLMLVTSIALYLPLRKTASRGLYHEIYELAQARDVATDARSDMCDPAINMNEPDIMRACSRWQAHDRAFVATAALSGVFAAAAVVFTGLLIRQRRHAPGAATLAAHGFEVVAAPRREGGLMVMGGLRF